MTKSKKTVRILILVLALISVALIASTGTLLARYISEQQQQASMKSKDFHVSSDYLSDASEIPTYSVSAWSSEGISFCVYNYELLNTSLVTEGDVKYFVEVPAGWNVSVRNANGETVTPEDGTYTMIGQSGATYHTVTLKNPTANENDEVLVTLKTAPYEKKLAANFRLLGKPKPEYKIEDKGNYVLVTVYTNNYSGAMTFTWTASFSPDNTNPMMASWTDAERSKNEVVAAKTTYELIFYKNEVVELNKPLAENTTVNVGE